MSTDPSQPIVALFVSRDLFFASKVTGTAAQLGFRVAIESDPQRAIERAGEPGCRCVILDLSLPGLSPGAFVAALPEVNRPRVLAYDAHVNAARLDSARAAGCDRVYTRGQLSASLPDLLRDALNEGFRAT